MNRIVSLVSLQNANIFAVYKLLLKKNAIANHDGYVPEDIGCGENDYIEFKYCLDCGQMQGKWPKPETEIEKKTKNWKIINK